MLQVDESRLKELMAERSIDSYAALAEETERIFGEKNGLHQRTIYNFAKGANWTRKTLEIICVALNCQPFDLVPALAGEKDERHTHAAPDTAQEPEIAQQPAV